MKTSYPTQKDAPSIDWHPAEIESAVKKRFGSYAALARVWSAENPEQPVGRHTLVKSARHRQSALGEAVISWAIEVPAASIWPSRYDEQGVRKSLRTRPVKDSSAGMQKSRKAALFDAVLGIEAGADAGANHG